MVYQFNRWTITLGAQVRALYGCLSSKDPDQLHRALEAYEAELQHLYAYAEEHHLDLIAYYHPFAEIEDLLFLIRESLQQQQAPLG